MNCIYETTSKIDITEIDKYIINTSVKSNDEFKLYTKDDIVNFAIELHKYYSHIDNMLKKLINQSEQKNNQKLFKILKGKQIASEVKVNFLKIILKSCNDDII